MMRTFAVGIVAASASVVPEELSLLQTSSVKVFGSDLHSSKDCKAARQAHKDAKTKVKTDKAAIKAARAALKAAKATLIESEKVKEDAAGDLLEACPVPEVDVDTPDEGCANTIVTSIRPADPNDLLDGVHCNPKYSNWVTQTLGPDAKCVAGGGVKEGDGQPMGDKLGISIMQPCSVAWTSGEFIYPPGVSNSGPWSGKRYGKPEVFFQEKQGLPSPCKCLEWARSVSEWPESIAVTFYKIRGVCRVHRKTDIPYKEGGPAMYLETSKTEANHNNAFTCYMGNPDAWKIQYQAEKDAHQLIDKCSKPEWSRWMLKLTDAKGKDEKGYRYKHLSTGSGVHGAVINIKECHKVAKNSPDCKDAVALSWNKAGGGTCQCVYQTSALEARGPRGAVENWVCML